ncbi:MAG: transcriptional repressor [Alphaproteobacteria bacterium]|nr:transcriptional repressor [Alphaproteobacteria bacterium]
MPHAHPPLPPAPFPAPSHDHARCVATALATAETLCGERGARLTGLRRQVLELVWESHGPIGAYDLLDRLRALRSGAAPPTVYRALEVLMEQGLVHRINRLNAFIGCAHPDAPHEGQFLICTRCGTTAELDEPAIAHAIEQRARALGFAVEHRTVEVTGLCPSCRPG